MSEHGLANSLEHVVRETVANGIRLELHEAAARSPARLGASRDPYFPDPLSWGIRATLEWSRHGGEAETDAVSLTIPFYPGDATWPNAQAVRLRLSAGSRQQTDPVLRFFPRERVLHVCLPAARQAVLRLSSVARGVGAPCQGARSLASVARLPAQLERHSRGLAVAAALQHAPGVAFSEGAEQVDEAMAGDLGRLPWPVRVEVLRAVKDGAFRPLLARLVARMAKTGRRAEGEVVDGQMEYETPSTTMRLLHAVRVPMFVPAAPDVRLVGPGGINLPLLQSEYPSAQAALNCSTIPCSSAAGSAEPPRVQLKWSSALDTKSSGHAMLRCSWVDAVDDPAQPSFAIVRKQDTLADAPVASVDAVTPTSWHPARPDGQPGDVMAPAAPVDDGRHRVVEYSVAATARHGEVFPGVPVLERTTNGPGTAIGHVPATRAPCPPYPAYVVPSFTWEAAQCPPTSERGYAFTSTRRGGAVRLYLHRPWFDSGIGEKLALIFRPKGGQDLVEGSTEWGLDPIRYVAPGAMASKRLSAYPTVEDVRPMPGVTVCRGVCVPGEGVADVLLLDPTFDEGQKLWFVDVPFLSPPAYSTFLRLRLARFQNYSLPGCCLSRAVHADFGMLLPDRSVTVFRDPSDPSGLTLRVVVVGVPAPTIRWGSGRRTVAAGLLNTLDVKVEMPVGNLPNIWIRDPEIVVTRDAGAAGQRAEDRRIHLRTEPGEQDRGPATLLWNGSVRWPASRTPRRLVIVEREEWVDSRDRPVLVPPHERVAYADVLEVPGPGSSG